MMVIEFNHIGLAIHDATNSDDIGPVKQKLKAMS